MIQGFVFVCILFLTSIRSHSQMVDFSNAMNLVTNHMGGFLGSGVSFVDFNNDGYDDITFGHHSGEIKFFVGNGNDFEEVELDESCFPYEFYDADRFIFVGAPGQETNIQASLSTPFG